MWFIGLEFAKTENLNIDLTVDIKQFTDLVDRQAQKMGKNGVKIDAKYVKR
jgi:poly(A) polymerase